MRIGSYNSTVRYRNSINRTYEDQTKIMEMSDGNKLHRPSDDCVGYSKYLRHSVTYQENNQYQTNVQTAISWMKNTDAALVDMTNCFSKIVVKSNQADGANSDADMRAIAGEMLVQAQQAVASANMNVNGRYLFSGQADLVQPYEISKEMQSRGLAKTLDDKQMEFFNDTTKSGDVAQMLVLEGSDGATYYLNTKTGNVYTQDFVEEGYKEKIAQGQGKVSMDDAVAAPINPNYHHIEPVPETHSFPMTPANTGTTFASTGLTVNSAFASALGGTPASVASNLTLITDTLTGAPYYYYNNGSGGPYDVYTIDDITTFSGSGTSIGNYPGGTLGTAPRLSVSNDFAVGLGYSNAAAANADLCIVTNSSGKPFYCDGNGKLYDVTVAATFSGSSVTPLPETYSFPPYSHVENTTVPSNFFEIQGVDGEKYYADMATGAITKGPITASKSPLYFTKENHDKGLIVGDLYAQNQKYTYADVVELNPAQQAYFGETDFVHVTDAEGNDYYYSPTTRDVYTKEFFNSGYDPGSTVKKSDAIDNMGAFYVAENFDSSGVIKDDDMAKASGKNWKNSYVINGQTVNMTLSTVSQYIVTYNGDRKQFSMVKENGATQPASDTVNASGVEIAGRGIFDNADSGNVVSGANAFNDMFTVHAMCEHGANDKKGNPTGPDSSWMNSDGKTLANAAYNTVNSAQTKIASRQSVYKDCQDMLTTQNQQVLGDITEVHSTDVSKLAVDMMTLQTVYNLSLNVGARILPQTLTDYLH